MIASVDGAAVAGGLTKALGNPADRVRAPRPEGREMTVWDGPQARQFLAGPVDQMIRAGDRDGKTIMKCKQPFDQAADNTLADTPTRSHWS